jgi:hypothetical protein
VSRVTEGGGHSYTEYGVICDRTGQGLGKALLVTGRKSRGLLAWAEEQCTIAGEHEHTPVLRRVHVTDWQEVRGG